MTDFHISDTQARALANRVRELENNLEEILRYIVPPDTGDIPAMMRFEKARKFARQLLRTKFTKEDFTLTPCPTERAGSLCE
jgi:hypothetical protein